MSASPQMEIARLLALAASLMPARNALGLVLNVLAADPTAAAAGIRQNEIAARAGVSDRAVRTALRQLEALGAVEKVRQAGSVYGYLLEPERVEIVQGALR